MLVVDGEQQGDGLLAALEEPPGAWPDEQHFLQQLGVWELAPNPTTVALYPDATLTNAVEETSVDWTWNHIAMPFLRGTYDTEGLRVTQLRKAWRSGVRRRLG